MRQIILFLAFLLPVCAFSQLKEPFDGPNVDSANPWKGDLNKFKISGEGWLRLDSRPMRDTAFLYVKGSVFYQNEWRFRVRSDEKGTMYNYFNLYLWSEKPSLKRPGLAYSIRVGYKENTIALIKNENQKKSLLAEGSTWGKGAFRIDIKACLDKEGILTVYSKSVEKELYKEEFSIKVDPIGEPGYFMIGFFYTTEHCTDKYLDNILISRMASDADQPDDSVGLRLIGVEQLSQKELIVTFSRPLDPDLSFFQLSGLGEANEVYYSEENNSFKLVWEESIKMGTDYTLSYSGIYDEYGNECKGDTTWRTSYGEGEVSSAYPLLINEVLADPKGLKSLPETEYVELHNTSGREVGLRGCSFVYDKTTVALGDVSIPAKGYAVLYREGRAISVDQTGIAVPLANFPAQLANAGGKLLQLKSPDGIRIDSVTYPKAKPGISWERSNQGWGYSTDSRGGTPGSRNSNAGKEPDNPDDPEPPVPPVPTDFLVLPGECIFNELLPNPTEGGSEYIELYNRSDRPLYLSGLGIALRKSDGMLRTHYPLSVITEPVQPGGYVLLTKSKEGVSSFYVVANPSALFEVPKLPILANTSATLVLYQGEEEEVIDEITYSSKWHAASVKNEKGVALERIDPDGRTQDAENWTSASSTSGYGTPGYRNSQYGASLPDGIAGVEVPVWDENNNRYWIRYLLDKPGYTCRMSVYDTSGRRVAEIVNHELLGTEGQLAWEGQSAGGRSLKAGVYIFYAELYHPTGNVKKYKKVFLVR